MTWGRPGRSITAPDPARKPEPSASDVGRTKRKLRKSRQPMKKTKQSEIHPSTPTWNLVERVASIVWNGAPFRTGEAHLRMAE